MWTNIILVKTIFGKLFGGYLSNIQFSFSTKIIKTDIPNVIIIFISAWDCALLGKFPVWNFTTSLFLFLLHLNYILL